MAALSVQIAAELGLNHNGNLNTALQMVEAAVEAGCDAVKVQAIRSEDFLPRGHDLWDASERCWLGWDGYATVCERAHRRGLRFGGTPSSVDGVQCLVSLGADYLKVSSDYLLRRDVIDAATKTGLPLVISTGMATLSEISSLLYRFRRSGARQPLTMLVCTSAYPCPDEETHLLRVTNAIWPLFGVQVGFSDHTLGSTAAVAAAALGATMIEKHFTLDRTQEGPDHHFAAEPAELETLVREVRRVERMLGSIRLRPTLSEQKVRDGWRVTEGALRTA